jgi:hypothetical protein
MLVKPTDRWLGRSQRIPRGRKIDRNGLNPIEVTEEESRWLAENFFAFPVADESAPPISPLLDSQTAPPTSDESNIQQTILDYLNTTPPAQIAQEIKGIGRQTADQMAVARPLDYGEVEAILNDRQIKAIKAFLSS